MTILMVNNKRFANHLEAKASLFNFVGRIHACIR